jgi:hypothetical protein
MQAHLIRKGFIFTLTSSMRPVLLKPADMNPMMKRERARKDGLKRV